MNWKNLVKQIPLIYKLNASIKCFQLKRELLALHHHYDTKIRTSDYHYSEAEAIETFKKRHHSIQPSFTPRIKGELRVFWVGACESQDETGFIQGLNQLGNIAIFYNIEGSYGPITNTIQSAANMTVSELRAANDQALIQRIKEAEIEGRIDVLIGQMWAHLYSAEALQKIRSLGIPIINIAMDDRLPLHWSTKDGFRMGSIGLNPSVDMVLTTAPETCAWYGVENCPAIFWPLASDPDIFSPKNNDVRNIDVLFIGNRYGIRGKIVDYLTKRGISVECYGNGWPNGYATAIHNVELSKRAKIILGVGTVGHCQDVYTLKLRDFDALMTGALYITHRNPDLLSLFEEGSEVECYETPKEAYLKIKFYLEHIEERLRIGKAGNEKAIIYHSWDERLTQTFQKLGLLEAQ